MDYHDLLYERPEIMLILDKQWLYIQRRYRMSARELQVAKLVCRGFNNEEIAGELKVRPGTVKTHLRNVYRRVHVKNKIAMLLRFVEQAIQLSDEFEKAGPVLVVQVLKGTKKIDSVGETSQKST